jgi:hypothetical protein
MHFVHQLHGPFNLEIAENLEMPSFRNRGVHGCKPIAAATSTNTALEQSFSENTVKTASKVCSPVFADFFWVRLAIGPPE